MKKHVINLANLLPAAMFSFFLLTLVSCQKESDSGNPTVPGKIKEFKNGDEFIRFTYHADGSLQKATVKSELNTGGETVDYVINYNAQKKIAEVNTATGEKIVPVYDNNVMVRADVFDGPIRISYTNYHYEGNNLKMATIYLNMGADFEPFLEFRFTRNAAGNVTKTETFITTAPNHLERAGHVNTVYDQKTNPLYEHRDFLALLWQSASKNNPVEEQHFDALLQPEDLYKYAYSYNAAGLPVKATVTVNSPGQTPQTQVLDFLYQ